MMKLTINVVWTQSDYGYIIGEILVNDENGKELMHDEDMYWKPNKLWERINKLFITNKRFKIEGKPTYYKKEQRLEIVAEDLKRAKEW